MNVFIILIFKFNDQVNSISKYRYLLIKLVSIESFSKNLLMSYCFILKNRRIFEKFGPENIFDTRLYVIYCPFILTDVYTPSMNSGSM